MFLHWRLNSGIITVIHVVTHAAGTKSEVAVSENEDSQGQSDVNEIEGASAAPESNGEDSTPKQEEEQDDNGGGTVESGLSTFSYDQLKAKSENPVTGIDFKRREVGSTTYNYDFHLNSSFKLAILTFFFSTSLSQAYLSDEEFETVLGMTKDAFYKLPKWKQDMTKKKVDLF